ncbi:hypothetical protein BCL57_002042 [Agromyces flavus]|uniref:DUF58 domain-containing protein n=1 Tax=Agromyces flavus TaxID=589382 RepID=A0A1H1PPR2_9MICO|nr:DUF58 domain-containing protein [Agromyces flavus]MCP2367883.1 hypothetical protein [Agromyces flavus]GGI47344.1 hypothetical protein GCM10010932_20320 [Agromyces flavus]SDS13176.1 Protein of unknown function DUF58 [Agromyces flavus]
MTLDTDTPATPATPPSQARIALRSVRRSIAASARTGLASARRAGDRVAAFAEPVTGVVSPVGWLVLVAAVVALGLAWALGWIELAFVGATLLAALLLAVPFVFGRMRYRVEIELQPRRVVAGERALGRLVVHNVADATSVPSQLELPVGRGLAEFVIPSIPAGGQHEELFAVPTQRRAVITAGPAASVRGDQLGLLRREVRWTEPVELFVHPVTARLKPSAAGLVRDLEGEITKTITDNDISFHALRAYEPGDALRNVHWRTSARTGQLMVRQYEETRRSQLLLVQATNRAHYASDEEFELAVSVLASLGVQVIRDATRLATATDRLRLNTATPTALLDDTSRIAPVESGALPVRDVVREAAKRVPTPSVVIVVGGSIAPLAEFRAVETVFGSDTQILVFRAELGAASRITRVGESTVVTVGTLDELSRLVRRVRP